MKKASAAGINGLILPDVPFEEKDEFSVYASKYGIDFISMIAPTSASRITKIAKEAQGFIYCVSSLGVTGTRSHITTDIDSMIDLVRAASNVPCAIGFGISNCNQAKEMAKKSDGAIVGSAIVKLIAEYGRDCVEPVTRFVREMKKAVMRAEE